MNGKECEDMFDFKAIISVELKNKTWNETVSLEKPFLEDFKKYLNSKYNPSIYFHAKVLSCDFAIPKAEQEDIDKLNEKEAFYITPKISDYDVLINFLAGLKEWVNNHDEEVFGKRIRVMVISKTFGDPLHLKDGKYVPSLTRQGLKNISEELQKGIDAFNYDINQVEVVHSKSEE